MFFPLPPQSWELLLVSKLGWDLAPITAFDFVDHLLCRVPFIGCDPAIARKHATTFLAVAVTGEYTLSFSHGAKDEREDEWM